MSLTHKLDVQRSGSFFGVPQVKLHPLPFTDLFMVADNLPLMKKDLFFPFSGDEPIVLVWIEPLYLAALLGQWPYLGKAGWAKHGLYHLHPSTRQPITVGGC
jgi:hypothetical protein